MTMVNVLANEFGCLGDSPDDSNSNLPIDPLLPHLPLAFDLQAVCGRFAAELSGWRISDCRIAFSKYHPRRNCCVCYRLTLTGGEGSAAFVQHVTVLWCHGGDAARRAESALRKVVVQSHAGPAISCWPLLDAVLWWFPNDPRLEEPALLEDMTRLRCQSLDAVVSCLSNGRGELIDHHVALVQYVPGRRVCARVDLNYRVCPEFAPLAVSMYVKADVERRGAQTHAVMAALTDGAAQRSGHLNTPVSLLWQPGVALHWQLACQGRTLNAGGAGVLVDEVRRVGESLAGFHATPVPLARSYDEAELRTRLMESRHLLSLVEPGWQTQADRIVDSLLHGAGRVASSPLATLHGDLHPGNILDDNGRLIFIDLDSVRVGPAVVELGAWVGDMLYRATLCRTPIPDVSAFWRAFLQAYREQGGFAYEEPQLAWCVAYHLFCRRACGGVASLKPGRYQAVPFLLRIAEHLSTADSLDVLAGDTARSQ